MRFVVLLGACAVLLSATAANVNADGLFPCPPSTGPGPQPGGDRSAVWSPKGARLALATSGEEGWTIQIADAKTHVRRSVGLGEEPSWAPDGSSLAVTRFVRVDWPECWSYGPAIFVVGADGTSARRLV